MKTQSSERSEIYVILCPRFHGISGNKTSVSLLSAVCHQQLAPISEAGLHIRDSKCFVRSKFSFPEALPLLIVTPMMIKVHVLGNTSGSLVVSSENRHWL